MSKKKIIITTGCPGAGKTTINRMIAEEFNLPLLVGDDLKHEMYPNSGYILEYPARLHKLRAELLRRAEAQFNAGSSLVVDYVILGKEYIDKWKNTFGDNLIFTVLIPELSCAIKRDIERDCWTSGAECIQDMRNQFVDLKDIIGANNYIDNTHQTPSETFLNIKDKIEKS